MTRFKTDKAILDSLVKHIQNQDFEPLSAAIERYILTREGHPRRLASVTIPLIPRDRPPGRLSPSSMGGCQREAAFKFVGMEQKISKNVKTELIFEDGNWRHHKWQAMFRDMELVLGRRNFRCLGVEERTKIPALYTAGSLDVRIAIRYKDKWYKIVVDIKGANDWAFDKVFRDRAPHPIYIHQILSYLKATGYKLGILLFDSKNRSEFMAWPVTYTDEAWAKTEKWAQGVIDNLEARTIPAKHPECEEGIFLYGERCRYADFCWGHYEKQGVKNLMYRNFKGVEEMWHQHGEGE